MKKVIISTEDLIKSAEEFKCKKEASKSLCISTPTYLNLLRKNDIYFPYPGDGYKNVDKQWLINNWVNTSKSLGDVAEESGILESFLYKKASEYKVTKRFKYRINETILLNEKDPSICYLAGLIATDGYVNTNSNFISLGFVGDSEKKLLEDISAYVQSTSPIFTYVKKDCTVNQIRLFSTEIKSFLLEKFNIIGKNKTFDLRAPDSFYNEDCAKAYVLGCLDGDGCISHLKVKKPNVALTTASKDFVHDLVNIVKKYTDVNVKYDESRYATLSVGGKHNVAKFLDWVYSTTSQLRLERKYERYLQVKDIVYATEQAK